MDMNKAKYVRLADGQYEYGTLIFEFGKETVYRPKGRAATFEKAEALNKLDKVSEVKRGKKSGPESPASDETWGSFLRVLSAGMDVRRPEKSREAG